MKLLTHNFLSSRFLKNVNTGYPLKIGVTKTECLSVDLDKDFLKNVLTKIDYGVLWSAADSIGESNGLPQPDGPVILENVSEEQIMQLHKVLMCIDVLEGHLECPETGRVFPIREGIPNLLVNEDEVA